MMSCFGKLDYFHAVAARAPTTAAAGRYAVDCSGSAISSTMKKEIKWENVSGFL